MRTLLVLFLLTFVSFVGYAQEIPAKANTIVITLPDSNNVSDKIIKILTNKDYPVKPADKNSKTITTGAKTLKNNSRVAMTAQVKGTEIILTGKIVVAAQGNMPIEYKGAKGTPIMNAWEEMDKIAKSFGGKLKYEVR